MNAMQALAVLDKITRQVNGPADFHDQRSLAINVLADAIKPPKDTDKADGKGEGDTDGDTATE